MIHYKNTSTALPVFCFDILDFFIQIGMYQNRSQIMEEAVDYALQNIEKMKTFTEGLHNKRKTQS